MIVSFIGSILYFCLSQNEATIPVMITFVRIGMVAGAFLTHYIPAILFPARFRATAIGFSTVVGMVIAIGGPQLGELYDPIPMIILAVFTVLQAILA